MAPTKKGKGKRARKPKERSVPADEEETLKKTTLEVHTLKDHLVLRRDVARQATADSEGLKQRLMELEKELEEARGDKRDIYEEMIRQYQQLQRQTNTQIQRLEEEKQNLQKHLGSTHTRSAFAMMLRLYSNHVPASLIFHLTNAPGEDAACQEEVRQSRADQAKTLEEKDQALAEMQRKVDVMETGYEQILHGSLDCLLSKLQTTKLSWEKQATSIHLEYKDRLKEFGLNPLEM
ncbi:hypothetical protein EYD10_12258 [Varanus komodoensis]|nr:hypothetical protein EYD10_12258 [Varanus komodoensis]